MESEKLFELKPWIEYDLFDKLIFIFSPLALIHGLMVGPADDIDTFFRLFISYSYFSTVFIGYYKKTILYRTFRIGFALGLFFIFAVYLYQSALFLLNYR